MPVAGTADNYKLGDQQVDAVYMGDVKVWPPVPSNLLGSARFSYDNAGGDASFVVYGGDYEVTWTDGGAPESFLDGVEATHNYPQVAFAPWATVTVTQGTMVSFVNNPTQSDTTLQPTLAIFAAAGLSELNIRFNDVSGAAVRKLTSVTFLIPPPLDSCEALFWYETELRTVVGQLGDSVSNFANMFSNCEALTTLPDLDTSSGTNFNNMFNRCRLLTTIPALDTSSGTNFGSMFNVCDALTSVTALDTSSGTNFSFMFNRCTSLPSVPSLDTANGISFYFMFNQCQALTSVPQLETSRGIYFGSIFNECISLTSIPALNTSNGTDFSYYVGGTNLTTIPMMDTSKGTNFYAMFRECRSLTSVPPIDTTNGTDFALMFFTCASLTTLPTLVTTKGTVFNGMFQQSAITAVPPWVDTTLGTGVDSMFEGCTGITSVPALNCTSATTSYYMFDNCINLTSNLAYGFRYNVGISTTMMQAPDIDTFFNNLGTADNAAKQQYVDIHQAAGRDSCNRAIAEAKGWMVWSDPGFYPGEP